METRLHDVTTSTGLLLLRLGAAGTLMMIGWGKVQMIIDGKLEFADPIGIGPAPSLMLVAFAEFICAGLVLLGLLTRIAAAPVVFAMGVAAFIFHAADPLIGPPPSKQGALLFFTVFLAIIFTGAGRFSLDGVIARKKAKKKIE